MRALDQARHYLDACLLVEAFEWSLKGISPPSNLLGVLDMRELRPNMVTVHLLKAFDNGAKGDNSRGTPKESRRRNNKLPVKVRILKAIVLQRDLHVSQGTNIE